MELKDIKTLAEISNEYNIPVKTLRSRLIYLTERGTLKENEDYKNLGHRQATILSPEGIKKIIM